MKERAKAMSDNNGYGRKSANTKKTAVFFRRSLAVVSAVVCAAVFSSCAKDIKKDVSRTSANDTSASGTETAGTRIPVQKSNGPLFDPYDRLVQSGEYTLKITVNEIIGGESIPTVTTSVHHDGKVRINVEESYKSSILCFLEDDRLYYFTAEGEKRFIEYEIPLQNITLHDDVLMFRGGGEMTLYGKDYTYESYVDGSGTVVKLLFSGDKLERKLVYGKGSDGFTAYSVELTENIKDVDKLFAV